MKKLLKTISFTDIHFGAKTNSEQHNQDCLDYIDWFCDIIRNDQSIDSIVFMGDWYENKPALNVLTMRYSQVAAEKLNELNLPIFFVVGNHDLYHKHLRTIYSTFKFNTLKNFNVINEPTIILELGQNGSLICPYLFHDEYQLLTQYKNIPVWWGHFEFKGFVITGHNVKMTSGPESDSFNKQTRIFSGHFHKRQTYGNVTYIGNTFPTNFADTGDAERGCMIYDHTTDEMEFLDWSQCPTYTRTSLSTLVDDDIIINKKARVECVADLPLSYEEFIVLRDEIVKKYELREFIIKESTEVNDSISDTDADVSEDDIVSLTTSDLIMKMLSNVEAPTIDPEILVQQYMRLK